MFYSLFSMSPYFLSYFTVLMLLAQPSWVRICLNFVFVLRSMCLGAFQHAHAFFFLLRNIACLCLDLLVYVLLALFMLGFTCLCAPCHAYAQIYIFVCSMPYSCVQIYILVAMPCASKVFLSLVIPFSCVLALQVRCRSRSCGLDLHPYTKAYIKGFELFPLCICTLSCFYALYPYLLVQIQGFAMLYALCGFMLVGLWGHLLAWLHPTTCETYLCDVGVPDTHLPPLRAMLLCLPCLLCAIRLAFFASLYLCTLAYVFMHESVRRSYSTLIELWTPDPNLHLSF